MPDELTEKCPERPSDKSRASYDLMLFAISSALLIALAKLPPSDNGLSQLIDRAIAAKQVAEWAPLLRRVKSPDG